MDVIIQPDEGQLKEIGQQLLALADDPRQVRWVTWPVAGYKVPAELAAKLRGVRSLPNTEQPAQGTELPQTETSRRRGRPRKTVDVEAPVLGTDDTVKEE